MKVELVVALIAGVVALLSAGGTIWSARQIERLKSVEQKRREISRYSEPLARAAYDLQSRIFNILNKGLIETYLIHGDERERIYVKENTTFLFAQYLCWVELVRREIQFIDLEERKKTRKLLRLQDNISSVWGSDQHPALLRIFAGEQRAIGEALIVVRTRGAECMGYGEFLKTFSEGTHPLIDAVRVDVERLGNSAESARSRLIKIQRLIIDLLDILDRDHLRFPRESRSKVSELRLPAA